MIKTKEDVHPAAPAAGPLSRPDVSVCIVNWNTRDLIDQCLGSIYRTRQQASFEVVVVDNGSQDDSPRLIAEQYPRVRLIRNAENRGFGGANNQAIRASRGRYCLLLNSDTLIFDGTLDAVIAFMDAHPDAAVVTGKVFKTPAADEIVPSYASTTPTPGILFFNDLISITGLKKLFPDSALIRRWTWTGWHPEQEQEVATITGACMGVRREATETVGLFDEAFFMYMEETDWCYRFLKAGWKIYYTPDVSIVHLCEGSSRLRNDRDRLYYRSLRRFFRKHYGYAGLLTYLLQEYLLLRWLRYLHRQWHRRRAR
jgi:GT2 family glycosyltransferase